MPSQDNNINNQFFDGIYKDVWRKIIPAGLTEAEADFILEAAQLEKGDRLLDLMCGYGRHTLELARRGIQVTATDNSKEYISEIQERTDGEALSVNAYVADAQNFETNVRFKGIICMGNSLSFFKAEDVLQLLRRISSVLEEKGTFIINSWMIAEIALRLFREKEWYYLDEYKYLLDYKYAFFPARIESEHTILAKDGSVDVIKGIDYILSLDELAGLCAQAGLCIIHLYSTPRKRPFNLGDNKIYIVIQKA